MPEKNKVSVGGQALMEGVMMNGPKGVAMALRLPDGRIETQLKEAHFLKDKYKFARLPFIRGPISFVEQMIFGYKCLMESAEKTTALEDDGTEEMSKLDRWLSDHFGPKMMTVIGIISGVIGFALAFFLFMWLPSQVADLILGKADSNVWKPAIEGVMRIIIFVTYMWAVSLMSDIKRLFMYHGAEHKSIFCYEHGLDLTVENVRKQRRFHPRCGTSFIFLTLIISIIISTIVVMIFPGVRDYKAVWMIIKILILPLIMSVGYETIRLAGKKDNLFTRIVSAPGLWLQRITTKEPTDDIIEVGIASLKVALGLEKEKAAGEIVDEAEKKAIDAVEGAKVVARDVLEKAKSLSHELISKTNAEKESQKELVEKLNAQSKSFKENLISLYEKQLEAIKNMNENVDIAKAQADEENIENELNDIYSSIDELSKADNVDKVIEEAKTVEIEEEQAADEEIEKETDEAEETSEVPAENIQESAQDDDKNEPEAVEENESADEKGQDKRP